MNLGVGYMVAFEKYYNKLKGKKSCEIGLDSVIYKNPDIDDTEIDGEKVMMDLDKGKYFMMNEVGSRVWEIIDISKSVKEIIEILCSEYEIDEEQCCNIVSDFLGSLNNAELISLN